MRKIFILFLVILAGCSKSDFNSKTQAENLVNERGFRNGRWVDFFDSDGNALIDSSDYFTYKLSEYENGMPVNGYKEYFKNGQLKSKGTFSTQNSGIEKNMVPNLLVGEYIEYNYFGDLLRKVNFHPNSSVVNKIYFFKKDSAIINYNYFKDSTIKTIEIIIPNLMKYKFSYVNKQLVSNDVFKKYDKSIKSLRRSLDKNFPADDNTLAKYDALKKFESIWVNKILKEDYSILNLDKIEIKDLKKSKDVVFPFRNEIAKIFNGNSNSSTTNSSANSISNSSFIGTKYCEYCNKRVNESFGYVSSLATVNCAKKISSVLFELSVAKQGGFSTSQLNQVSAAYKLGTYYCSKRCIFLNGESICN